VKFVRLTREEMGHLTRGGQGKKGRGYQSSSFHNFPAFTHALVAYSSEKGASECFGAKGRARKEKFSKVFNY